MSEMPWRRHQMPWAGWSAATSAQASRHHDEQYDDNRAGTVPSMHAQTLIRGVAGDNPGLRIFAELSDAGRCRPRQARAGANIHPS